MFDRKFLGGFHFYAIVLVTLVVFDHQFTRAADVHPLSWAKLNPPISPSARENFAMAYDPISKKTILFGGANETKLLGDTWTFDGQSWTQVQTLVAPSPRIGMMLAYDAVAKRMVLFGGEGEEAILGDTWLWDGAALTWTQANSKSSPGPLIGAMLFTDPKDGHAELFGGFNGTIDSGLTWKWTGSNWIELHRLVSPSARHDAIVGNDNVNKNVVISDGLGSLNPISTWTWDGNTWTEQFPSNKLPDVSFAGAAYDPFLRTLLVFGGMTGLGPLNVTVAWTGSNWLLVPTQQAPPPRMLLGMAYDRTNHETIIFGGLGKTDLLNDTWKLTAH
jgi:hypothetical protein